MKKQLFILLLTLLPKVANADISGTCGKNLTWTLVETTGGLMISGSGPMTEYDGYESVPWYSHRAKITEVVINDGVSSIGKCAFYGCSNMTKATIPNSVSYISNYGFYECSSLTSVNIPNGVTSIGYLGFADCTSLTKITLPESLTTLGEFTFKGCSSLSVVTVLAITPPTCYDDFSDNAPSRIFYVPANSLSQYKSQWRKYSSYIYYIGEKVGNCGEKVTYSFDDSTGLLSISGEGAMYDFNIYTQTPWKSFSASIKSVIIQDGVTSIGGNAFSECHFLSSIIIPNSVVDISAGALTGTAWYDNQPDGLIYAGKVAYSYKGEAPDNTEVNIKEGTISIAAYAFFACNGMSSVTIPNSVTAIGSNAFDACKNLTSVNIPKSVTTIEPYTFEGCSSLNTITIPYSVTTIGGAAFQGCSGLTSVKISDGVISIGNSAFSGCKSIISVTIPYSVTTIGKSAFSGCQSLSEIILPNSVSSIGDGVFNGCSSLTSIDIPRNITSISNSMFKGCSGLTSVNIPNNATTIGGNAFEGCSGLTSIIIPNSVSYIGSSAFQNCNNLVSVEMSHSITSVEIAVFYGCSSLTSISIPNGVTAISSSAFQGCSSLTSIIIPNSVTDIGKFSFEGCSSLSSVTIPNSVVYIGYGAFQGCSDLDEIIIPEGVESIGNYSFSGCSTLSSVCISSSVKTIGNMVFYNCSNLKSIVVDKNNTVFDSRDNCNAIIKTSTNELLYGCNNSIIPNGVSAILYPAFNGYKGITSLSIPASVTRIEDNAFVGCTELASINVDAANPKYDSRDNCNAIIETETNKLILAGNNALIPNSVTAFSQNAFKNCIYVSLPDGMERITYNMFNGCDKLETIIIPASVTVIESNAFYQCTNLANVIISDSDSELTFVRSYGNSGRYCFEDCPLDTVYIGRNFKGQYDYSDNSGVRYSPFSGMSTITSVELGNKVTKITRDAFFNCTGLTTITIPESVRSIGFYAFSGCTGISEISVPNSVVKIEGSAFAGCKKLQSIKIPDTLEEIEGYVFCGCESLTSVIIPGSVNNIGQRAFWDCKNLSDLTFEDGNTALNIVTGDYASFYSNPIRSIYLGRNLFISNHLFYSLPDSLDVTVGKTVTSLTGGILAGSKIKTITFEDCPDTLLIRNNSWQKGTYQEQPFDKCFIDSIYMGRVIVHKNIYSSTYAMDPFTRTESSFSLRIGDNIKEIGDGAYSWWKIDSLYIPKTVKIIRSSPFQNCSFLNDVFIEDGEDILEFRDGIGFYVSQLRNLYLGRNISYPEGCSPFSRNKEGLKSLTIGNCVTEIGEAMFTGCVSLTNIEFPQSVKKIGTYAFYGCTGLTTLNIPSNITEIDKDAFNLCTGLASVHIDDADEPLSIDNNFMNCELKKVYLGRNINYPDHFSPFSGLEYLDSLVIGPKVTAIGNAAFTDCRNLKDVVSYSEVVPLTGQDVFTESYLPDATLHVPYSLYEQYKETFPWSLFGKIVNFEGLYNLTFMVNDEVYKTVVLKQGEIISAETEPSAKDGYTFSGWSEIPEKMPAHDVTIIGSFVANNYQIIYVVDGVEYKIITIAYDTELTAETAPEKEGYTFSGWSEIPDTMPAHDVTVTGSFTINQYTVKFIVDGDVVSEQMLDYGTAIVAPEITEKEGYTFSGWDEVPETVPAHDVIVTGSFIVNKYKIRYYDGDNLIAEDEVEYGAEVVLRDYTPEDSNRYTFIGWDGEKYETMPAHDIEYHANIADGVGQLVGVPDGVEAIYDANGRKLSKMQRGVNILLMNDGTKRKVIMK